MATLKDIAQATGLSMNTVSRAIRGSGYVSLKTAELVRKTVKELDYHPNRAAQDLRRRKSRQITVVAESYDYLHIEKLAAIKEYAANCGYTMGVHFTSEDYPQSTFSALLPDILEQNPAGLIIIASSGFIIGKVRELRKKMPCVMITFDGVPDIDCVYIDRFGGVYDSIRYLYGKGRRRIVFCETFRSRNRKLGYQKAVRELGLPELIISGNLKSLPEIRKDGVRIAKEMAAWKNPPDAVQTSDYMASGLLAGFAEAGIAVPQDIAVLGFDDRELAGMLNPPLTTLAQPSAEVGRISAQMLFERISGTQKNTSPENIRVPMHLVIRNSA
ncbi:MAG: LacI family DNA-binding transcriptional regulator [Victivallales bacterium]|nr:LacI family DNA-binding transcriptional regulator [Lentisphaeria bacterium]HCG25088.1 hypothetical protein [Lentisphaeria bacterium]HCG49600.1 hypothetical protein [Lentisphaeria bacterium]